MPGTPGRECVSAEGAGALERAPPPRCQDVSLETLRFHGDAHRLLRDKHEPGLAAVVHYPLVPEGDDQPGYAVVHRRLEVMRDRAASRSHAPSPGNPSPRPRRPTAAA